MCLWMGKEGWSVFIWYLLVVELQGTNRDEERKGGPNPFWEKLCRGRLESCVQHKRQGGAYLWPPLKPVTLLVGYAQDVQPWVRDQTYSSQSDRQWLSDWLFLVKFCLTLFHLQGRDTKEAQLSEKMCFSLSCFLPAAVDITVHSDSKFLI